MDAKSGAAATERTPISFEAARRRLRPAWGTPPNGWGGTKLMVVEREAEEGRLGRSPVEGERAGDRPDERWDWADERWDGGADGQPSRAALDRWARLLAPIPLEPFRLFRLAMGQLSHARSGADEAPDPDGPDDPDQPPDAA